MYLQQLLLSSCMLLLVHNFICIIALRTIYHTQVYDVVDQCMVTSCIRYFANNSICWGSNIAPTVCTDSIIHPTTELLPCIHHSLACYLSSQQPVLKQVQYYEEITMLQLQLCICWAIGAVARCDKLSAPYRCAIFPLLQLLHESWTGISSLFHFKQLFKFYKLDYNSWGYKLCSFDDVILWPMKYFVLSAKLLQDSLQTILS